MEDNGPGFQRELIGQLFDPYVTTKENGTGLGLAIVRKIAIDHGGALCYIAPTRVNLELTIERWPDVRFHATRELVHA